MASATQRAGKKGKQQFSHAGYRSGSNGGGVRDHYNAHQSSSLTTQPNLPGVYSNPDMAFALVNIVGCVVDVRMQSGKVYQGVLKAVSHKLSIALALAHDKSVEMSSENTEKLMQLEFADIVSVSVLPECNPNLNSTDIFKTDMEISRSNGPSLSRELQPFSFEDENQSTLHLDDGSRGWSAEEMFETNRSKFKVESSYDEEMTEYTTKLDRSDTKDYQDREERAAKLAREIELNPGSQKCKTLEDGTEEELFSSVVRYTSYDDSAFPPLPTSTASSSSSSLVEPDPCKGTAESSVTTPSMNGLSQRAAEVAPSTLNSQTLPEPSISIASSSSSLSSMNNSTGFPQEAKTTSLYLSAVVNGRTNLHDEAAAKLDERTWPPLEAKGAGAATVKATGSEDAASSQEAGTKGGALVLAGVVSEAAEEVDVEMAEADQQQQEPPLDVESDHIASSANGVSQVQEELAPDNPLKDDVVEDGEDEKATEMADQRTWPAVEGQETSASTESLKSEDADKKVKEFALNPDAKSFTFNPNAKEFVPKMDQSSQSVTPVQDLPAHRHAPSQQSMTGKRYPKPQGRHNYSQDHTGSYTSTPFIYNQPPAQQVPAVMGRAPLPAQGPGMQFSPRHFHPSYPLTTANFAPQGIINPSQVLAAPQQKFYSEVGAVFPGQQHYSVPVPPQQIMQQPPHSLALTGQLLTSASQPTLITSPASLVGTPAAGGMVYMQGTQMPPASNTPIYSPMMVQQVGNPVTSTDMMGGQQSFYQ